MPDSKQARYRFRAIARPQTRERDRTFARIFVAAHKGQDCSVGFCQTVDHPLANMCTDQLARLIHNCPFLAFKA
jgi:hypothetical protein